jgi:hypothetical protein
MIEEEKDITLNEMILRLREKGAVSVGRSALDVWLRKRGWTFKNTAHALEQEQEQEQERTDLLSVARTGLAASWPGVALHLIPRIDLKDFRKIAGHLI